MSVRTPNEHGGSNGLVSVVIIIIGLGAAGFALGIDIFPYLRDASLWFLDAAAAFLDAVFGDGSARR